MLTPKNGKKTNLKYYYAYFNSRRKEIVQRLARGTNKKAINDTRLRTYSVSYPDKDEQDRIGGIVDETFLKIENLKKQIAEETERISTLL